MEGEDRSGFRAAGSSVVMRQSTRLILNTGATYARMALTVGIGLLVTRYALRGLGEVDLGISGLLLATIAWVQILTDSIIQASDRFFAFELGKADHGRLRRVFASSLVLLLLTAGLVVGVGAALMPFIVDLLQIPPARAASAERALLFTALMSGFAVAGFPYRSMFTAHQEMVFMSAVEVSESVLRLGAVLALLFIPGDRLVIYSALLFALQVLVSVGVALVSMKRYPETRVWPTAASGAIIREMAHFSAWSVLGTLAQRLRLSGAPTALARVFGPVHNAAYQVSFQAGSYQFQLAQAIFRAARPAVTQAHGSGNEALSQRLAMLTSKYCGWMVVAPLVPVLVETDILLKLWLGSYPEWTREFVRLMCVAMALPWLMAGTQLLIQASGRVKALMICSLVCEGAGLAAGFFWSRATGDPSKLLLASLLGALANVLLTAGWLGRAVQLHFARYLRDVLVPLGLSMAPATAMALAIHWAVPDTSPARAFGRLIAVCAAYFGGLALGVWFLGLSKDERGHFQRVGVGIASRLPGPVKGVGLRLIGGQEAPPTRASLETLGDDPAAPPSEV